MLAIAIMVLGHVSAPRLFDLYDVAEVIAVGTVVASDTRVATMKVERWLKGGRGTIVRYRINQHFRCDTSDAVVGERKLMFLDSDRDGVLAISWSGRGRRDVVDEEVKALEQWIAHEHEPSSFRLETDTEGALPASLLKCRSRDRQAYRGCLVVPREGHDVTPQKTGEALRCFFDADSKLECWRFPSGT